MDNKTKNEVKIEVPVELENGTYSNFVIISHTPSEFVLDFASIMPGIKAGKVRSRIVMAPEHTKRLMLALQNNIANYEQRNGAIRLHGEPENNMSPFGMNGEA